MWSQKNYTCFITDVLTFFWTNLKQEHVKWDSWVDERSNVSQIIIHCQSLVLDRNTWQYITVQIIFISYE